MQNEKIISRKLLEATIIEKALNDKEFKSRLLAHPTEAITELNLPLPEGKTIRVTEEPEGTIEIVLPKESAEASDTELEAVAGGGLIQNGKCDDVEEIRRVKNRVSDYEVNHMVWQTIAGAFITKSWGWG